VTSISLRRGRDREPGGGGGLFHRDCERQVEEDSGDGASVSVGLCEGNLEGSSFSGDFKIYM
jgi:hypothetical protein